MNYQDRLIVFIDILGFKNIIKKTTNADGTDVPSEIDHIYSVYKLIKSVLSIDVKTDNSDSDITIFSDTIVITFVIETGKNILFNHLLRITNITVNLISKGILCRGSIVRGKVIHNNDIIFGPGLVEAYLYESKAALYPRIIVSPEIINYAAEYGTYAQEKEKRVLSQFLAYDTDGMYYINYISPNGTQMKYENRPEYFKMLYKLISSNINNNLPPDVRIKYLWLKDKYNKKIESLHSPETASFFEKLNNEELTAKFMSLKFID